MRRWLAVMALLSAVCLQADISWGAGGVEVVGVVANWQKVKEKMPESAYFQLVKFHKELKGTTDSDGYSAFESKLPKIKVKADGSFKLVAKTLSDGNYFIALQRALPKEVTGDSLASAIPILITEKEEPFIIRVPDDYPLNAGKVFLAVRAPKEKKDAPAAPAPEKGKEEAPGGQAPEKAEKEPSTPPAPKKD